MKIPTISGTIDRRILINYTADQEVVRRFLSLPFRPKLVLGKALVGICLIRLKSIRPKSLPLNIGVSSENAAHRIAVEWTEDGEIKEGVYVPRRDTSSRLNTWVGGRVFPGVHHLADFKVREGNGLYSIEFKSDDKTCLEIEASETGEWNPQSIFENMECASDFFRQGTVGYSPDKIGDAFEGLELKTKTWKVSPLTVKKVKSNFFENESIFPNGSIQFDNALLMRDIDHEWNIKKKIISHK